VGNRQIAYQIRHGVGFALDNAARAGHVEREAIAPLAGIDANCSLLLAEESFFAEREQDWAFVFRRMVEDVGVLVGLFRETTIENLESTFRAPK
jgi:hypothetical protein